jgi:phage host-nuclease inhibitor protein Gam
MNSLAKKETTKVKDIKSPMTLDEKVNRYTEIYTENENLAAEYSKAVEDLKNQYKDRFDTLKEEAELLKENIKIDCAHNREDLFPKGAKSIIVGRAKLAFRAGSPSLELLDGYTWEQVLQKAEKFGDTYIVRKPQLDKNKLKQLNNDAEGRKLMKKLGVTVVSEETFSITID